MDLAHEVMGNARGLLQAARTRKRRPSGSCPRPTGPQRYTPFGSGGLTSRRFSALERRRLYALHSSYKCCRRSTARLRRILNEAAALEVLPVVRNYVLAQMLSERLSTPSAASLSASASDGCAWQIAHVFGRGAELHGEHRLGDKLGGVRPMMCTPRISSVFACASTFAMPAVSPSARSTFAEKGNTPARYWTPSLFSCCSVLPTRRSRGSYRSPREWC